MCQISIQYYFEESEFSCQGTACEDLVVGKVGKMQEGKLFKEVELPGRGTGLVASCDLQPGVLLLAEQPLLIVPWWQRLTQFNRL